VAEGPKLIKDLMGSGLEVHSIFTSELDTAIEHEVVSVTLIELQKISFLKTPNTMLAVFHIPKESTPTQSGLSVALDAVRDPGNLGTIIRLCDWFGVKQLICGWNTVDCYNPKVVQATMGSIARVSILYEDLSEYIKKTNVPVFAAVMDGKSVYQSTLPKDAILVMGNEANGISPELVSAIEHKLTIPHFGTSETAESLNVATATAILLSEFRRNS